MWFHKWGKCGCFVLMIKMTFLSTIRLTCNSTLRAIRVQRLNFLVEIKGFEPETAAAAVGFAVAVDWDPDTSHPASSAASGPRSRAATRAGTAAVSAA